MADEFVNVITRMKLLNANGPARLAVQTSPAQRVNLLAGTGVLPGRRVYDTVTGQMATVIGSAVAYLPQSMIDEARNG